MYRRIDTALSAAIVALGIFVAWAASQIPMGIYKDAVGPRAFFYGCAIVFILGGLASIGIRLYAWRRQAGAIATAEGGDDEAGYPVAAWRVWALFALSLLYTALFQPLGYLLATPLYLVGALVLLQVRRPVAVGLIAVIFTLLFYYVFAQVLNVRIPVGPFTDLFRELGWIIL